MLEQTKIDELYGYLMLKYPFININTNENGFEEALIKEKLQEAWDLIPIRCKKRRNEIVALLTIHLLLHGRKLASDWDIQDNTVDEKLLKIDTGDIRTEAKDRDNEIPISYRGTRWGAMAYHYIRMCAKARIGLIK